MESSAPAARDVGNPVALRPAVPAAVLLIVGIVLYRHVPVLPLLGVCLVALFAAAAFFLIKHSRLSTASIAAGLVCAGTTLAQLYAFQFPPNDIGAFSGDDARLANLELEILTPPRVLTDP